jgi:3-mercaptopyruvate sulfurtransferase SseA
MSNSTSTSTSANSPEPAEVQLTSDVDSISELFARDPIEWDDAVMARMVSHYRKTRKELKEQEAKGKKPTAAKIPKEDLTGLKGEDLLGKLGL